MYLYMNYLYHFLFYCIIYDTPVFHLPLRAIEIINNAVHKSSIYIAITNIGARAEDECV